MSVIDHEGKRIVGHVAVRIASQVVSVPVHAAPVDAAHAAGFFIEGTEGYGILVDSQASEAEQRRSIEASTVEAARYLSRRFLN